MNTKLFQSITPVVSFCLLLAISLPVYGKDDAQRKTHPNQSDTILRLDSILNQAKDSTKLWIYEAAAKLSKLYFQDAQYYQTAWLASKYLRKLEPLKDTARSESFKKTHTDLIFWYGYALAHMGHYDKAIRQFHTIYKLYGTNENSYYYAKANRGLGATYGMCNKNSKAEECFRKHLKVSEKLKDYEGICGSLSNLGIMQLRKNQPDSALVYLLEANKVAVRHPDLCEMERVLYLTGAAYCTLGQTDLGNKFLQDAISVAKSKEKHYLLLFIENYRIHNLLKAGDYAAAKKECLEHYKSVKKYHAKDLEADALDVLSLLYSKERDYPNAYKYLKLNQEISYSLFNKESEERLEALNIDFENYKAIQAKEVMQKDIQLSQIKIEKRNLFITILLLILFLFITFSTWFIRRYQLQRKLTRLLHHRLANLSRQKNEQLDSIREKLENEITMKDKELISHLLIQMNTNETITDVKKKLQVIKNSFASGGKICMLICEMESQLSSLDKNKDLNAFQFYFEQVHDSFFENLSREFPSLTLNEKRLCALISIQLTTKEIASLINRTVRGVETAKFRLRKKMQLSQEDSLTEYILKFKSQMKQP